jgi:acetolactate synthase-1/2/3 large subunit
MVTASMALLDALTEAGMSHIFANFGSDHPALIEAIAEARAKGRVIPTVVTCPNEMVALSCAHGFAQVSGRAQAVIVHVDCGTQALAGALHNAMRGRVPVFIFAGLSPATQEGEAVGSRNEFIHWLQDVPDQRAIARQYVKYENEIRSPANIKQIVHRALQIAESEPKGPVYLTAAREVLDGEAPAAPIDRARWQPTGAAALPPQAAEMLVDKLARAHRPLVVTSYLGRQPAAVEELVKLCTRLGIGVLESVPSAMNYPPSDPLHQGSQWNQPVQNVALAEADVVLVLDSDVPWVPTINRPAAGAEIFHIDTDPLKPSMSLWYIGAHGAYAADVLTALRQMNACLDGAAIDREAADARRRHYARRHAALAAARIARGHGADGAITADFLTGALRNAIGEDAIVLNEGITNYDVIFDLMARGKPGTIFASGGSSLGWHGGAAIGAKLAAPERDVVSLTGDGSYLFSVPSTVHWMARRYRTPFLTVVYNNGGWRAPKFSALAVHPDGYASRAADLGVGFDPAPDHGGIAAAAGGAFARKVQRPEDVDGAIAEALAAVRVEKRAAVLDVVLPHL